MGTDHGIHRHPCADVLTLDPNLSDAEKAKQSERPYRGDSEGIPLLQDTTEYASTPPMEDTPTGDVYHLLWSSDRLEIAREVDTRLTRIYTDLVSLEKMMHYKYSIIDLLKDVLPELDTDEGRRLTLVEECHERWVENARNLRNGNGRKEDVR